MNCADDSPRIKLIIFDLDGVLVDSRELHYEALNRALEEVDPKYIINRDEHLAKYDGRPTTAKLNMLTAEKQLPISMHNEVWRLKQDKTFEVINDTYKYDNRLRSVLAGLKAKGLTLYCASNSIYKTLQLMLLRRGLLEYFDFILSCEEVLHAKPAPDVYVHCMMRHNLGPAEVLIVEDSHVGRKAALLSGAHLCPVEDPACVTLEKLLMRIEHINMVQRVLPPQESIKALNIVVPMASAYEEYQDNGFVYAGPLVEVNGRPMVKMVVDNLKISAKYTFVTMENDYTRYNLKFLLEAIAPGSSIITSETPTEGPTQTVLMAKGLIDNSEPLLISNCHQFIEWNADQFHAFCESSDADGVIATFTNSHPRFSYVSLNDDGFVTDVAEKDTISNEATCGVYYWKEGSKFVQYAEKMVKEAKEMSKECSVIMAYQQAIKDGLKFEIFHCERSWPLKFPKDLENFYRSKKTC